MTCVAYRAGVLASDSLVCCGNSKMGEMLKIASSKTGFLGGASGDAAWVSEFLAWVEGDQLDARPKPDKEAGSALLIHPDGRLEVIDSAGAFTPSDGDYWAIGCGRAEALGAMFAGADAETAVRAAIAHDPFCGGTVRVLKLGKGS